jgi:hypothetical protein
MAAGNRHLGYKAALNLLEATSPGTKAAFYFEYLDKAAHLFAAAGLDERMPVGRCTRCGSPASADVCAFCRVVEKSAGATPVTMGRQR